MQTMQVICREAAVQDVDMLFELIKGYAEKGIMLPRTREAITSTIDAFVVAELDGQVVGCGSLTRLGDNLVEIRSLGMNDGYKGMGIGSKLVECLMGKAKEQGFTKVMALTYEDAFFEKNGFHIVDKDIFPEKVWRDCVNCPKKLACDEIAVLREIRD